MKRGTVEHPKTLRLARLLNLERWGAVGILESLWHFTAKNALQGDVGKWSNWEIAASIGWMSEADPLIEALLQAGFLDADPQYRLLIHDWHEHCDQAVKKTLDNRGLPFAEKTLGEFPEKFTRPDGKVPSSIRLGSGSGSGSGSGAGASCAQPNGECLCQEDVLAVFSHWRIHHPKSGTTLKRGSKEWRAIKDRLKEGFTVESLCEAIDGCHKTPHNLGQNEKGEKYLGLELIMRTASQVTRFIENNSRVPGPVLTEREKRNLDALKQWAGDSGNDSEGQD